MSFLYGLKNKRLDGRAIVQASGKMAGILMNKKKFKACAPLGTDCGKLAGVLMNKFKALNV